VDKEQVPLKRWLKQRRRNKEQAQKMSLEILRLIEEESKNCIEIAEITGLSYGNTWNYIKRLESAGALTHIYKEDMSMESNI